MTITTANIGHAIIAALELLDGVEIEGGDDKAEIVGIDRTDPSNIVLHMDDYSMFRVSVVRER